MNLVILTEIAHIALEKDRESSIADDMDLSEEEMADIKTELDNFCNNLNPIMLDYSIENKKNANILKLGKQTKNVSVIFGKDILLHPDGINDCDGEAPIALEYSDGKVTLHVWGKYQEEPILSQTLEEDKPKFWNVPICRIGYGRRTVQVQAQSEEEALDIAKEMAGGLIYSEKSSRYEFPDGAMGPF